MLGDIPRAGSAPVLGSPGVGALPHHVPTSCPYRRIESMDDDILAMPLPMSDSRMYG